MLGGGSFHYFGIKHSLRAFFEKVWSTVPSGHTFNLQLNFDGLPIFKSSSLQFWPVLGIVKNYIKIPVLIALFCGCSKPNSLSEYLSALVNELKTIGKGFPVKGKTFFITLSSVVCDAPARAFIKGIKSHTGYHSCDKCVQKGVYVNHRMTFPETTASLRTGESFKTLDDDAHHVESSPLSEIIDMIKGFPHDYMHLVCLGVMRRLLGLWIGSNGPLQCRVSASQVSLISDKLVALRGFIPNEFARKPRSLFERLRWKATELRQFLLYTGPVVLREILHSEVYQNFMLLSVGIYILASPEYCSTMNDFANSLLVAFVKHFSELYGPEFVSYNVHGLTHLSQDVKVHGSLDVISGFPFENYLRKLKKMVRRPHCPLTQVIRRISELDFLHLNSDFSIHPQKRFKMQHSDGPVPLHFEVVLQFKEVEFNGFVIKVSTGDSCIKIDNKIVIVQNIIVHEDREYVVCQEYQHKAIFFEYPIDSSCLGIFVVSKLSPNLHCLPIGSGMLKYVRLPLDDKYLVIPLLHIQ
ncbi:uncharacterized protein si:dkey-242h9.3 [Erpetoichthys calabaricus]|uniref:uncharacterized protein si:dkey-242h9.3 n=1 Tax=Erpetoichthys calabaricus TaxID=27687 RepID=UPI0022343C1E|nr:uncharacterized protein si:dkey-242h9.3 [Erpetoichthys calabaricus]